MILTIAGPPGSGKSTVAKMLAEKLQLKRYYMGGIQRELARKHDMTIEEWNEYCAENKDADQEIEDYQENLGKTEDNLVIEGRTSFHVIPHSVKLYIDVSDEEAARRLMKDETAGEQRNELTFSSIEEKKQNLIERKANEKRRYKEHYGIDAHDPQNFDLVVDTTNITPDQVVEQILNYLKEKGHI